MLTDQQKEQVQYLRSLYFPWEEIAERLQMPVSSLLYQLRPERSRTLERRRYDRRKNEQIRMLKAQIRHLEQRLKEAEGRA